MAFFMQRFDAQAYALMRIVTGFLFLWHGMQKLFGFPPSDFPGPIPAFITWVAGPIELVGGTLVMLGLFTPWAAFVCSGQMAIAYFMGHAFPGLEKGALAFLLPLVNRGELAALYCFVFLFISTRGSGIWSVDAARGAR